MKFIFKVLIVGLILSSCCREEAIETARYALKTEELGLIPYQKGEETNFIHSNGYLFGLKVVEDRLEWNEYRDFCEWSCCGIDYFSYQVKTLILESTYPKFQIEMSLGGTSFNEYDPNVLNIKLNNRHHIQFPYDISSNLISDSVSNILFYESIVLNNKEFDNVFMRQFDFFNIDSTVLVPKSMYFNDLGIVQIEMSNDETYTLHK